MTHETERERMIQEMLDRTSLLREEVEEFIAIYLGESDGDIVPVPPVSREERRRRFGLGLTLEEARVRMAENARSPQPIEPPVVTSLSPEEREEVIAELVATTSIPPENADEEIDVYLTGGVRASGRPVLFNERRLIGNRITRVLERRAARPAAPVAHD